MVRKKIILGDYAYIIDYYDNNENNNDLHHYEKFHIIKNQEFKNGILIDKDIYFISEENENIIYPISHEVAFGYSTNINKFNENLNNESLNKEIYKLYNSNKEEISLLCDKIRIYIPIINNSLNSVIDVQNFINDIQFHYLIRLSNDYTRKSDTEFIVENNRYSEYIEIYIPCIKNLLYSNDIYISEYNKCINKKTLESFNLDGSSLVPFNILYYPYSIYSDIKVNGDVEYTKEFDITPNYINNQFYNTINVILYPYSGIDENDIYIIDSDLNSNSCSFNIDISFNLKSQLRFPVQNDFEFENEYAEYYGIPCIISDFEFPNSDKLSLKESYLFFNGSTQNDYDEFINNKDDDNELFGEDYEGINKSGFFIEISTDKLFTNVFFKYFMELDNIIDNCVFPLSNIFNTWEDIPNTIIYRISFIDKVNCNIIRSNPVLITKEWYKYLINESGVTKLKLNKIYKLNKDNMTLNEINKDNILFIDKINCSIIKSNDNENSINIKKVNNPKIIYKPIFYRTTELQNINLKANVNQNIGINLSEYLTKVETFKLFINQNEYIEIGRNDIYVIFQINTNELENTSGTYIITNENDEYISDGNYLVS